MKISSIIAKQFRDAFFGSNWTTTNLKEVLADVNFEQANKKIDSFNTIIALTFHIQYFISEALIDVLEGKPLAAHDKFSFIHTEIKNENEWQIFLKKIFADVEKATTLIKQLPDEKLQENFADKKYGSYYRNIHGIIEHTHYHLGQIVILKKLIQE
jgi:uncharacterized damage-inducible protein DinB